MGYYLADDQITWMCRKREYTSHFPFFSVVVEDVTFPLPENQVLSQTKQIESYILASTGSLLKLPTTQILSVYLVPGPREMGWI